MLPRIFVASSVEGLEIAYAIQENLQYDGTVTVWTQGIFNLSSNTLDDLIAALDNFEFAIMIFKPDDIATIRGSQVTAVRDNVLFELGLFIGKLGKKKVFIVLPVNEKNFHIPTDLTGMSVGEYDAKRPDGNVKAALGPFCNNVRKELKKHHYTNLSLLRNESEEVKRIAIDKPSGWEYLLLAELIESRLKAVNVRINELDKKLIFIKNVLLNQEEYRDWVQARIQDLLDLANISNKILNGEIQAALGPSGVPAEIPSLIDVSNKYYATCSDLLNWELSIMEVTAPQAQRPVKEIMQGWGIRLVNELKQLPGEIRRVVHAANNPASNQADLKIQLSFKSPEDMDRIFQFL